MSFDRYAGFWSRTAANPLTNFVGTSFKVRTNFAIGACIVPNNFASSSSRLGNEANALIEVFDLMGKKVFTQNKASGKTTIDITNQHKGIYLVRITIGDEAFNEKMIYQ